MTEPADDERWMRVALQQARLAADRGEVPVGAVAVLDGQLIAAAGNTVIAEHDPSGHAEMGVLRQAGQKLGNYRLVGIDVFVTLEPCAMCAGALIHARVRRVCYGVKDPKTGAAGSVFDVLNAPFAGHRPLVHHGVLAQECAAALQDFFAERRGS